MNDKKILDVTCGSRTIWFNKHHPAAIYCDIRKEELTGIWKSENGKSETSKSLDEEKSEYHKQLVIIDNT